MQNLNKVNLNYFLQLFQYTIRVGFPTEIKVSTRCESFRWTLRVYVIENTLGGDIEGRLKSEVESLM